MTNPTTLTATPGQLTVDVVREFDAPVEAVFRAHTDPDLVTQWMGPRGLTMQIDEWNAVTGGTWQYVSTEPGGGRFGFRGVFHTVVPNEIIIQTFEWDGAPHQTNLGRAVFEDLGGGRTRLTTRAVFLEQEARDGMVASGMEYGQREGYERLDELLAGAGSGAE